MALERADALAPATRLRLLLARAAALLSGSLWTEAAPDLEAARAVAQAGGEVPSELRVESARLGAVLARRQGRLDEAERQIAEARAGLDASVPAAARGELGVAEGDVAVAEGDLIRGVGLFDEAVRLFDGVGNQLAAAHARRHLAVYLLALGRHEDALVHLEQALHVTLDLGAAPAEAALRQSLGHLCLDLGRAAEAEGHFDAAAAIFEQLKAPGKVGEIWVARGVLQLDRGLPEQEVSGFEEARRWLEQASSWRFLVVLAVNEVLTALSFGRPDAARRALTSLAARGVTPDPRTAAYLGAVEAVVLAWEGEIARALAQIAEAQQVLPGQMHAVNHEVLRTLHACVLALGARGGAAEPDALAAARARERDVGEGGALSNLLARSSDLRITARILRQLLAGVEVQGPEMGALAGDGPALAAWEAPAAAPG